MRFGVDAGKGRRLGRPAVSECLLATGRLGGGSRQQYRGNRAAGAGDRGLEACRAGKFAR